jgi:regulator of sigma E protease
MQFSYYSALITFLAGPRDAIVGVLAILFLLGVLIFVHELGHYAMAKLFAVRVETFSLGFGKRLWGFRRGETDYRISLLPLGGYVKMAGENPMEERTGDPGEFMSHPRWQRFIIAIAGPVMNIILAVAVLTGVNMVHHERPILANVGVVQAGSPAEKAGIQTGDRIIKIDNVKNPGWEQVWERVAINPKQPIDVTVRRGDRVIDTKLTPAETGPDRAGDAGWLPMKEAAVVSEVMPNNPAARAGLMAGDTITAINGAPVQSSQEMVNRLQEAKGSPVEVSVLRGGKELKFTLRPELNAQEKRYMIGIAFNVDRLSFPQALDAALAECKSNSILIFELVPKMLTGKNSIKQMSGPVGIMQVTYMTAVMGSWPRFLKLMALISVNLAVFNLLPIPILDGGLMLMLLIEGIMRRDIKQEIKERVYQAAFVFLLLFAAVVIFNDVAKHF